MAKNLFRVKEINLYIQGLLADDALLQNIWIEGEISNFKCHSSGHWYFTLKGEEAALKCIVFRQWTKGVFFLPEDGMEVRVRGSIAVYERDGQYILYGEEVTAIGTSNQYAQFCALREQLYQEGLFDESRKKPLPAYPKKIAVVTSVDGAAWHDMQKIFAQKIPAEIILLPCSVQGINSESSIVQAITMAGKRSDIDVLIVSRGGGSKEDLAVFNTEGVTRAVSESLLPVISAVGHEIDYTLVDLAADVRVPTPTAAANIVLPDKAVVRQQLWSMKNRLIAVMADSVTSQYEHLQGLTRGCSIHTLLAQQRLILQRSLRRLLLHMETVKEEKQMQFQKQAMRLSLSDPMQILAKGYGIASKQLYGVPVKSISEIATKESLYLQMIDGVIHCKVEQVALADAVAVLQQKGKE